VFRKSGEGENKRRTVVVDGRQDGNRFLGNVNARENSRSFRDTGKTFVEHLRREMAELEEDMIFLGPDTTALTDFDGHRARNNITRSKVLGGRGIAFHETFTFGVQEVTSFTAGAYCL
jgi:hypothetical protein